MAGWQPERGGAGRCVPRHSAAEGGPVIVWLRDASHCGVIASQAAPGTDRATVRLDAFPTGLDAGCGAATAVGLMLVESHSEGSLLC
jgi:hypothetical protein